MKKYFPLLAFTMVAFMTMAQDNSETEAEIRKLEDIVVTAILHADTNTLQQVWAAEFLVNNPRNNISGNRDSVFLTQKSGMINYSTFERIIERIQFQKDLVITMGYEIFVSRNNIPGAIAGQVYKRRFTNIWMKKNERWLQIARHASNICE